MGEVDGPVCKQAFRVTAYRPSPDVLVETFYTTPFGADRTVSRCSTAGLLQESLCCWPKVFADGVEPRREGKRSEILWRLLSFPMREKK